MVWRTLGFYLGEMGEVVVSRGIMSSVMPS